MNVPDVLIPKVRSLIEDYHHDLAEIERLNTEEGFQAMCSEELPHGMAIVRQSTYPEASMEAGVHVIFRRSRGILLPAVKDPPVMMRGSRHRLHRKYSKSYGGCCPTGWMELVVERYCEMKKITAISEDDKEMREFASCVQKSKRFSGIRLPRIGKFFEVVLIEGKKYSVARENFPLMKALKRQLDKVTSAETLALRIQNLA